MSEADNSTTPIRSRRAVLAGIAASTMMPSSALLATPAPDDPIYAAIAAHREVYATMQAKFAEHRRAHRLADARVGPYQIEVPSMVEPGKDVLASCWWDIEQAIPSEKYPDLYRHYCDVLEERQAARAAIIEPLIGDEDEATNEVASAELEVRDAFEETVPTTVAGLLAMLIYAGQCSENDADAFTNDGTLIENLANAARALVGLS